LNPGFLVAPSAIAPGLPGMTEGEMAIAPGLPGMTLPLFFVIPDNPLKFCERSEQNLSGAIRNPETLLSAPSVPSTTVLPTPPGFLVALPRRNIGVACQE